MIDLVSGTIEQRGRSSKFPNCRGISITENGDLRISLFLYEKAKMGISELSGAAK
jgi:hypothetical protein